MLKTKITLNVEGMRCKHCAQAVEKASASVKSVKKADVDLDKKTVTLTVTDEDFDIQAVKSAIEAEGYTVVESSLRFL